MKLYAISDLHLGHPVNRTAPARLPKHPEDRLILAGDAGGQGYLCEIRPEAPL